MSEEFRELSHIFLDLGVGYCHPPKPPRRLQLWIRGRNALDYTLDSGRFSAAADQ